MARYNSVLRHLKMEDVKAKNEWRRSEEKAKQIALQEQQYLLHFTQNFSVPKHYDWRAGKFNEDSLVEINKIILKRIQEIDDALSEGMTTKDFKYLYGGIVVNDIVSINPELVSSTFAQDIINASGEVTSYMFGPDFPGSHINSIGDFSPQSYSKVDVLATASWNSLQDMTPSGWTPENSYEYIDSVSDVVSPGQETDTFKDTYFGEVTTSGNTISLSTGDDEDSDQENTVDIADLRTLFPGVTFPQSLVSPAASDPPDPEDTAPYEASMLLRTFKSVKVGQVITFDYSFTSLETEEDGAGLPIQVNYRGETRDVAGDDSNYDDYTFVLIAGRVQKIVSVLAQDGNNLDFSFSDDPEGGGYLKPDVLQSRFPLTGSYSYTVQQNDIDDYGNLKMFIGVMDAGDTVYESNLDIRNFELDNSRIAAGQLGQTTDAYNLGSSVASLDPNSKKKKKKEEDVETDPTQDSKDPEETKQKEKEIVDKENQDEKEVESIPQNKKEEKKILDDAKKEEQKEDKEIEKEKESDEREEEKEKLIDEFEGDEEEKNIFSQLLDSALDYAAEITGHKTSKAVLDLYNKFLNDGANKVHKYNSKTKTFSQVDWKSVATVDAAGKGGYTPGMNPVVKTNKDGDVDLRKNGVISNSDLTSLQSVLNDSNFERIYERAMNANNEKSKQLYLHSLADLVEEKVQNQILSNKGLRNSLFGGVKLDRNAFLQSNGKYISFTKDYQFRPGGSVAEAEKTWIGRALTALGVDLDTLGAGNLIDKVGGVVASKLLTDGADKFGGLYKAPPMRMRLNLHHRGGGNTGRLPYKSSSNWSGYVNKGAWWEEDAEVGKKQLSSYKYSQNWTPEAIGPYHSLNPRTGQWERPGGENWTGDRFGIDWEGRTDQQRALTVHDDFWWLDPNFKDLTKFADTYDKKDDEPINDVSDVSATDAATLASELKKKKKKKGQGGRELGDTTKRGGVSEQLYPGQPSPDGFPETPPPKMAPNGYHPQFGKRANRYRRLDPHSAAAMPKTGDPQTDAQVAAAKKKNKLRPKYNSVLRHLNMKDVKEKNELRRKEEKSKQLESLTQKPIKHYDWREDLDRGGDTYYNK